MGEVEVGCFERAGDSRRVFISREGEGVLVREELEGPSVEIAYGGTRRVLKVLFSAEAMSLLVREIGFVAKKGGLWDYLAGQDGGVLDLMDLCDRKGIPYVFSSTGDGGDCQFRPVG